MNDRRKKKKHGDSEAERKKHYIETLREKVKNCKIKCLAQFINEMSQLAHFLYFYISNEYININDNTYAMRCDACICAFIECQMINTSNYKLLNVFNSRHQTSTTIVFVVVVDTLATSSPLVMVIINRILYVGASSKPWFCNHRLFVYR